MFHLKYFINLLIELFKNNPVKFILLIFITLLFYKIHTKDSIVTKKKTYLTYSKYYGDNLFIYNSDGSYYILKLEIDDIINNDTNNKIIIYKDTSDLYIFYIIIIVLLIMWFIISWITEDGWGFNECRKDSYYKLVKRYDDYSKGKSFFVLNKRIILDMDINYQISDHRVYDYIDIYMSVKHLLPIFRGTVVDNRNEIINNILDD